MTYDIIATLGPACASPETWQEMIAAGATQFRLNSSHLSVTEVVVWIERLRAFFDLHRLPLPVVVDLQGSKWRLGQLPTAELKAGLTVKLIHASTSHNPTILPVPHRDFFAAAPLSTRELRLNDAKVLLEIEEIGADFLLARVTQGGTIAAHKGITFAESHFRAEGLADKDKAVLTATQQYPFVRYAISYVKDVEEMIAYRKQIGATIYLVAKLERRQAVEDAQKIAMEADEVWLCRGDLGAELGPVGMAAAAFRFSEIVASLPMPAMLAGQVLEHMTEKPTPTRSEITAMYTALQQAYQGFVLSDETAVGCFPVESVRTAAQFRAPTQA